MHPYPPQSWIAARCQKCLVGIVLIGLLGPSPVRGQDRFGSPSASDARDRNLSLGSTNQFGTSNWLNAGSSGNQQWLLGIRGENTTTGVMVREVQRGSAAERARIEAGDMIVSVGGYQVGMVGRQVFDISAEINRRASSAGLASVLVQDHVSGRLANVEVQLASKNKVLRGQLVYRGRSRLPDDAVVTINVENLSRPHFESLLLNNTFAASEVINLSFEVPYDPAYIYSDDIYEIRATVTSQGSTLLASNRSERVIMQGTPQNVQLELVPLAQLVSTNGPGVGAVTAGYKNYDDIDGQIVRQYEKFLGRAPNTIELVAWRESPALSSMQLELMASQEYFDLVGNNSRVWIAQVFTVIVGKQPTANELDQWLVYFARLRNSRMDLLRSLQQAANR